MFLSLLLAARFLVQRNIDHARRTRDKHHESVKANASARRSMIMSPNSMAQMSQQQLQLDSGVEMIQSEDGGNNDAAVHRMTSFCVSNGHFDAGLQLGLSLPKLLAEQCGSSVKDGAARLMKRANELAADRHTMESSLAERMNLAVQLAQYAVDATPDDRDMKKSLQSMKEDLADLEKEEHLEKKHKRRVSRMVRQERGITHGRFDSSRQISHGRFASEEGESDEEFSSSDEEDESVLATGLTPLQQLVKLWPPKGTNGDCPLAVSFRNLGVELGSFDTEGNHVRALRHVNGELRPGRLCAVMGPSGCGKTTFLSALSNKIHGGGRVLGDTYVNGSKMDKATGIGNFNKVIGFVPQEDTMLRELSTKQNIQYASRLQNSGSKHSSDVVNAILRVLDIYRVKHVNIGDEHVRGISGGQRKRVNVAMELAGDPSMILLDEPTSGLDSGSSLELIKTLSTLAKERGITIAMVIHQPVSILSFLLFLCSPLP
jgi:ABC-type multidrug transport system ATPase subunit